MISLKKVHDYLVGAGLPVESISTSREAGERLCRFVEKDGETYRFDLSRALSQAEADQLQTLINAVDGVDRTDEIAAAVKDEVADIPEWMRMTPKEAEAWIGANVKDLATAKQALGKMALVLFYLVRLAELD